MKDGEECEMYQTEMERVLSHSIIWWQTECRRMELDHKRCIENRDNQNIKLDKALDTIKQILNGETPDIDTGVKYLDELCKKLVKKLGKET